MSGLSAEEEYYRKHYGGGVAPGVNERALARFELEMLAPGKRYHLALKFLERGVSPQSLVAELGCGGGQALFVLQRRFGLEQAIGIDIAAAIESDLPPGVKLIAGNLNTAWPLADGSVDYLLAMMVIEHLFDPFTAFAEIRRVLKPGGVAFVNLPLVTGLKNRLRLLRGQLPATSIDYERWFEAREWDGNHLHYFSVESIRTLARATRLEVGEIAGVGKFHQLKSLAPSLLAGEITFTLQQAKDSR